jgi:APA family basic amino acid/polyamine antiporter
VVNGLKREELVATNSMILSLPTLTEAHGDLMVVARVALAMGKEHELPAWIGAVDKRFRSPHHAVLALGILCSLLALFLDLRPMLEVANVFTLVWYCIVHFDALRLEKDKRLVWPAVSWLGLVGCFALFVSLPVWAPITGFGTLVLVTVIRYFVRRWNAPTSAGAR